MTDLLRYAGSLLAWSIALIGGLATTTFFLLLAADRYGLLDIPLDLDSGLEQTHGGER